MIDKTIIKLYRNLKFILIGIFSCLVFAICMVNIQADRAFAAELQEEIKYDVIEWTGTFESTYGEDISDNIVVTYWDETANRTDITSSVNYGFPEDNSEGKIDAGNYILTVETDDGKFFTHLYTIKPKTVIVNWDGTFQNELGKAISTDITAKYESLTGWQDATVSGIPQPNSIADSYILTATTTDGNYALSSTQKVYVIKDTALERQVEALEAEITSLKSDMATLQNTIQSQSSRISELTGKIEDLEADAETLNGTVSSLQSTIQTQTGKITDLTNKIGELTTESTELGTQVATLNGTVLSLQSTIQSQVGKINELTGKIGNLETNAETLNVTISALNTKIDGMKSDFDKKLDGLGNKLDAVQNTEASDSGSLKNEIAEMKVSLQDLLNENSELAKSNQSKLIAGILLIVFLILIMISAAGLFVVKSMKNKTGVFKDNLKGVIMSKSQIDPKWCDDVGRGLNKLKKTLYDFEDDVNRKRSNGVAYGYADIDYEIKELYKSFNGVENALPDYEPEIGSDYDAYKMNDCGSENYGPNRTVRMVTNLGKRCGSVTVVKADVITKRKNKFEE